MSHKIKDMGNMSRTGDAIKKKLELSFSSPQDIVPINEHQEIKNSADQDLRNYGNDVVKPTSIIPEINKCQSPANLHDIRAADPSFGNRYKKVVPRASGSVKAKATFCLDSVAVEQLNQVYIKRLSSYQKSDRSSLICEAISLLFEKEKA